MAQLTIYVADDLAADLKRFKQEINLSRVCQEALRAKVAEGELARKVAALSYRPEY